MELQYESIRRLLARVRARYRAVELCRAIVRMALSVSAVVGLAVAAQTLALQAVRSPIALIAVAVLALVFAGAAAVWAAIPLRRHHHDLHIARFVEERVPSLDDRLVTA